MKVFVCIATTINGLVTAGVPHDEWVSSVSWGAYLERLKQTDVAIVGSKTYKVMGDEEFPPNLSYIVLTHQEGLTPRPNVTFSQEQPKELIERLGQEGHSSIGILGGAETISEYLAAGVVDELYIDIESVVSGKGKNLVMPDLEVHRFELIDVKQLDTDSAQLHYIVKK